MAASSPSSTDSDILEKPNGQDEVEIRNTASPTPMSDAEDGPSNISDDDAESEDGSDEDEDEDDEEYEDEDEDEEPALKYERIGGAVPDLLKKDSASALAIANSHMALGTHGGIVHILDLAGKRIKSYKPHSASIVDISLDATADFVATASMDGQVVIHSLSSPETYAVALEPNFAKRGTRGFVCGGLAGTLILREKGWLGHKDTILHSGEGPIWQVRWRGRLIAWANDLGVKIYDHTSQTRITFIDRPVDSPRPDLFKCTLHWQDDSTFSLLARIRARPRTNNSAASANLPPLLVEITAVFQLDCMMSGVLPHPTPVPSSPPPSALLSSPKSADRPELRIISRGGEEIAADAISLTHFQSWGCNDYVLSEVGRSYVVLSPKDLVLRYEEALEEVERLEEGQQADEENPLNASEIGQRYIEYLVNEKDYVKAARLCPKVCSHDSKRWEDWIFAFAEKHELQVCVNNHPYVPTESPRLDHLVYEMMLAHFLTHDRQTLLQTIKDWPKDIYDIAAVIVAVHSELDRAASSSYSVRSSPDSTILMECLAELYIANRQPGKALPFFLRLRRPNVFDLIREHNLFTDVQDQVLLLVEFDNELIQKRKVMGLPADEEQSDAITLLVDNTHSISIGRVVQQLQTKPYYLFLYLHALVDKDPHLVSNFADLQVKLYAEYATPRLIDFLRVTNYYNLEMAYSVCESKDLVPEMVFLLGRMGNNKQALTLIIERLGDVHRAIDFAKEQGDDDLWEDLLRYSETRPAFIRGLLENVGAEISPIRLIRRIKNGLEIPGLKEALIKILQDFHLQISLLEGCHTILNGDSSDLSRKLQNDQTNGFFLTANTCCPICSRPLQDTPQGLNLLFLCRHVVHATCASGGDQLPDQPNPMLREIGLGPVSARGVNGKIAFESTIRKRLDRGCPVCEKKGEGWRRNS
ncbi:hypothetical protein BD779DRAFT_1532495 [Infundibulicybe gibba]|nr:hypothetical protein BD779DRAFT_1532495 [Infundibulicybe gibba]